jgi:hypothetical protein
MMHGIRRHEEIQTQVHESSYRRFLALTLIYMALFSDLGFICCIRERLREFRG